jgi:hypothetical protein
MQPYQQRVVDESFELNLKTAKLNNFIVAGTVFNRLPLSQQRLLRAQLRAMQAYVEILMLRIEDFDIDAQAVE